MPNRSSSEYGLVAILFFPEIRRIILYTIFVLSRVGKTSLWFFLVITICHLPSTMLFLFLYPCYEDHFSILYCTWYRTPGVNDTLTAYFLPIKHLAWTVHTFRPIGLLCPISSTVLCVIRKWLYWLRWNALKKMQIFTSLTGVSTFYLFGIMHLLLFKTISFLINLH